MKKTYMLLMCISLFVLACGNNQNSTGNNPGTTETDVNPQSDWHFGAALWTFHTFNFVDAINKIDSAGLKYIEPNTFHKIGGVLNDTLLGALSVAGIEKLKEMIANKGLTCESIYIAGDTSLSSWVKQFAIAKQLGVKFVTTEPPLNMWDAIDSVAGINGVKVAIHEHWKGVSHYWNPDTTLMAIKDHPNFGVCADLGHWPKSGINPLDAVKKLSGHIIGIHLKDIAAYNDPALRDVPVGKGVVDFPAIFAELKKQNFKGNIYIERDAEDQPSNLPSVIETVKYYNEQIGKLK